MKARSWIVIGYSAQAMVSPVDPDAANGGGGTLITATDVVNSAADSGQLVSMLEEAEEVTGERRGQTLVMTERYQADLRDPYFKDQFRSDPATDSYTCPQGQQLVFRGNRDTR